MHTNACCYAHTQEFRNHVEGIGLHFTSLQWCWPWQRCWRCGRGRGLGRGEIIGFLRLANCMTTSYSRCRGWEKSESLNRPSAPSASHFAMISHPPALCFHSHMAHTLEPSKQPICSCFIYCSCSCPLLKCQIIWRMQMSGMRKLNIYCILLIRYAGQTYVQMDREIVLYLKHAISLYSMNYIGALVQGRKKTEVTSVCIVAHTAMHVHVYIA